MKDTLNYKTTSSYPKHKDTILGNRTSVLTTTTIDWLLSGVSQSISLELTSTPIPFLLLNNLLPLLNL